MSCTVYSTSLFSDLVQQEARSRAASQVEGISGSRRENSTRSAAIHTLSLKGSDSQLAAERSIRSLHTHGSHRSTAPSPNSSETLRHQIRCKQKKVEAKKILRNRTYWQEQERLQAESERQVRERIERAAAKKEAQFQRMYNGLTKGEEFTDSIEHMLEMQAEQDHRKKQSLFNEWSDKVFNPIQQKISSKIDGKHPKETGKMRRAEYEKFLESTNKKSSLFLDIIIESDYDPFVPNRNCISYNVDNADDPTKRMLTRYDEEKHMVPGMSNDGTGKEGSRDTLDVLMWGTGKIECTPFGHFTKMLEGQTDEKKLATYKTNFKIDHYNYPTGKECVDAEVPKASATNLASFACLVREVISCRPFSCFIGFCRSQGKRTDFSQFGIKAMR